MDYRAYVWDNTQLADSPDGDEVEVMLVEHVTNMLDIIESELQSVMEELKHIKGISEIDNAKRKLGKILGGEIMTFGEDGADKILERINMIEDEIDNHKHSIFLLEDEQKHLLDELREIQEQDRLAEDRAWRQMKL